MKKQLESVSHGKVNNVVWTPNVKYPYKDQIFTTKNYLAPYLTSNDSLTSKYGGDRARSKTIQCPAIVGGQLGSIHSNIPPFENVGIARTFLTVKKKIKSSDIRDDKNTVFWKIRRNIESYLRNSTLHGLRYVGDGTISLGERVFWLVAFVLAAIGAAYFIGNIYAKYNINPVIVTMNPTPTAVQQIPFPAVTICNMNVAKKSESELIMSKGTASDKSLLDDACDTINTTVSSADIVDEETGKWDNVLKFMTRVSQSCEEMLKVCKWRLQTTKCEEIFTQVITDEGLCCNFNQLPITHILRDPGTTNEATSLDYKFNKYDVDDWNPERGYSPNASFDVYPFRSPGPGAHLGLTLVLDAAIDNYYCSSSSSVGFKVLLHNPAEIPEMSDFAFMMPSGSEIRVVFKPSITDATLSLRSIDYKKRHCYFTGERYLKYYRTYTKINCKMECLTNITLRRCGCVPYYLPKNSKTKICGKMQEACSDSVREMMDLKHTAADEEKQCDCLPACFQLDFDKSMSYGKLTDSFNLSKEIIRNESAEYFMKNMVVIHIYFVNTQFSKFTKSELYGFSEFLSNTGGLLGLFLGFSALSVVEILYHFTLRALCSCARLRKNRKQNRVRVVQ